MVRTKGATREERDELRRQQTCTRRANHYVDLMRQARWELRSPTETLRHACEFLRAVAKGLAPDDVYALAETVTRLADERNH